MNSRRLGLTANITVSLKLPFVKTAIEAPESQTRISRRAENRSRTIKKTIFPVNDNSFARHSKTDTKANRFTFRSAKIRLSGGKRRACRQIQTKQRFLRSIRSGARFAGNSDDGRFSLATGNSAGALVSRRAARLRDDAAENARGAQRQFLDDYVQSVKALRGWEDGGRFFTNYIAHPMQGSFVGFIQVQNDPKGMKQRFGGSGDYWRSRMKAMAWSAAWSTQFEIGPISQHQSAMSV
jgi:hypothetical protein